MKNTWRKTTALAATGLLAASLAVPVSAQPFSAAAGSAASIAASASTAAGSATAASAAASSVEKRLVDVAGFKSAANFKAYYANLKRAVAKGDKAAVAARVHYPLTVYNGDDDAKTKKRVIKTKAQFLNNYNKIFTEDIRESLADTSFSELFVNWQGAMVDDGDIWFTPSKSGLPGISTVNLDD
ncbi:hypothetical protein [Saccharibacillus alkalitolerans]|uniref:Uncharacterized protein n=1 Tax=Saccharibacillus alkalitolerans TaxID=2705290 RepID=A0ABX0F1V8_9BACL|nr:hypothetical protein [Saccharibacillus alkalitolerans]NGZ74962.1 hypothetical protein [Saccharibacillus alkalitolerans]